MRTPIIPYVEITQDVLEALDEHKQIEGQERAGVLVGVVLGNNRYRIKKVSPSMTIEGATRTGCERDANLANTFVQEQYEQSGHTCIIYLGEWHTHPEVDPTPSGIDIFSIIKIAYLPDNTLPFVILCIVGLEKNYWGCVVNNKIRRMDIHVV